MERLKKESIEEVKYYILQLVQAIKYEERVNGSLVKMMIDFSLSDTEFATTFYWHLCVEMEDLKFKEKFNLVRVILFKALKNTKIEKIFEPQKNLIDKFSEIITILSKTKKDRPAKVKSLSFFFI